MYIKQIPTSPAGEGKHLTYPDATECQTFFLFKVFNTGIIPAKIMFTENTTVSWIENKTTETPLGFMRLHDLSAKNKRATINDTTTFFITDQAAFGRFTGSMITSQNFTWRLTSYNIQVQALKFPAAKGITFDKYLTINGILPIILTLIL